jgi:AcrR family transcriptional regulator
MSTISSSEQPSGSSSVSDAVPRRGRHAHCRRGEFIEALLTLCEREGFAAVTARRLALETRRSPMALYRHFDSMEHLVTAAWGELSERLNRMIWSAAQQADNPIDELAIVFRGFVRFAEHRPQLFRFLIATPIRIPPSSTTHGLMDGFHRMHELIQRGVERGVFRPDLDPRDEALRVVFLMIGNATLMVSSRRETVALCPPAMVLEATLQEALAGLLPRPVATPVLS